MVGNSLRELDRFLNLLVDEVAAAIALADLDHAGFVRLRNTANKLRTVRAAMALPSPDDDRLRAIGRTAACLYHTAEIERGGDRPIPPRRLALAERITPDAAELAEICRFYDRVAAELLDACAAHILSAQPVRTEPVVPARGVRQAQAERSGGEPIRSWSDAWRARHPSRRA